MDIRRPGPKRKLTKTTTQTKRRKADDDGKAKKGTMSFGRKSIGRMTISWHITVTSVAPNVSRPNQLRGWDERN
jgi:hypothetical protein